MYEVFLDSQPEKFLQKCEHILRSRIEKKLEKLQTNPYPDFKRIHADIYRTRVGTYRILYSIVHEKNEIIIIKIDKRERVYSAFHDEEQNH